MRALSFALETVWISLKKKWNSKNESDVLEFEKLHLKY